MLPRNPEYVRNSKVRRVATALLVGSAIGTIAPQAVGAEIPTRKLKPTAEKKTTTALNKRFQSGASMLAGRILELSAAVGNKATQHKDKNDRTLAVSSFRLSASDSNSTDIGSYRLEAVAPVGANGQANTKNAQRVSITESSTDGSSLSFLFNRDEKSKNWRFRGDYLSKSGQNVVIDASTKVASKNNRQITRNQLGLAVLQAVNTLENAAQGKTTGDMPPVFTGIERQITLPKPTCDVGYKYEANQNTCTREDGMMIEADCSSNARQRPLYRDQCIVLPYPVLSRQVDKQ